MSEEAATVLFDTEKYEVVAYDNCLGEDGKYGQLGYAVINKDTTIIEHTTMMFPGAIFQAQHFNDTLKSLLEEGAEAPTLSVVDDIIPADSELN